MTAWKFLTNGSATRAQLNVTFGYPNFVKIDFDLLDDAIAMKKRQLYYKR